ncbi:MAG: hypothetical protein MJZ61_01170 [Bacteroidales bacterium]|nr:hypothetical protein [Bacteroidales bacterium]
MVYFKSNVKKRKSSSMLKWAIYAIVLVAALFIFIPRFLIYKANTLLETAIPKGKNTADSLPCKEAYMAYNYLQVAKFFPTGEGSAKEGQKLILDYYFPLFKEDYNKLKFACVENAIKELKKQPEIDPDSINIKALESEWIKYPDNEALEEFRAKWDTYHKFYSRSLPEYYRFIDPNHL